MPPIAVSRIHTVVQGRVLTPAERARSRMQDAIRIGLEVDGVFEGGGTLGGAYIGALRCLQDNGLWFKRVAGNSAGAITASMIAAGYDANEIQWLTSAFPGAPEPPRSLARLQITQPIRFSEFLDPPTPASYTAAQKRRTLLWYLLNGTILDTLGKIELPIPTRSQATAAVVSGILSHPILGAPFPPVGPSRGLLNTAVSTALTPLPAAQLTLKDLFFDTTALRRALADALFDALVTSFPVALVLTNLLHRGAVFEGDVFLNTIQDLLARKVFNWSGPGAPPVKFKDLPIPLAVIACDVRRGEMLVYSSNATPEFNVAEAVRQSMCIPFAFEPRGGNSSVVDGGLCSNFPVWLYTSLGAAHWPPGSISDSRLKVGFSLDDQRQPPAATNPRPGRLETTGSPPRVDTARVLASQLVERLVAQGVSRSSAEAAVLAAFGVAGAGAADLPDMLLFRLAGQVAFNGVLGTEKALREILVTHLMRDHKYLDISIPLLGYSAGDFHVNEDEAAIVEMWDRGWKATAPGLVAAKADGRLQSILPLRAIESPFRQG
jgi:predicted acylesterase/phospholipase RssA